MVYYVSLTYMETAYGSVCFETYKSSTTITGPSDLENVYLYHIPTTSWKPPAKSAAVDPSSFVLTAAKYGLVYSPTAATSHLLTGGYYASAFWY